MEPLFYSSDMCFSCLYFLTQCGMVESILKWDLGATDFVP